MRYNATGRKAVRRRAMKTIKTVEEISRDIIDTIHKKGFNIEIVDGEFFLFKGKILIKQSRDIQSILNIGLHSPKGKPN